MEKTKENETLLKKARKTKKELAELREDLRETKKEGT